MPPLTLKLLHDVDFEILYNKLYGACNIDYDMSIVEWLCRNSFIDGEPFGFNGYEYLIEPLNDNYPRQAVTKPAQKGASEAFARKMFYILYKYALTAHYYTDERGKESVVLGINGIYSFPNDKDLQEFAKDRIKTKIIEACPVLHTGMKQSQSESNSQIGVYKSFCYLKGRKSDSAVQSVPAEVLMNDEHDRPLDSDRKNIISLNARLKNARIFGNRFHKGLRIDYGTPTLPDETGTLIEGKYHLSDQKTWMVKCTHCNHRQEVLYPDSIAHFYDRGQKKPKHEPYWMCLKCKRPLDFTQIGRWSRREPNVVHNAEWVAKYPERTLNGDGIRGYRIPFATLKDTAISILSQRDNDYKDNYTYFMNYVLGRGHMDSSISVTDSDFVKSVVNDLEWGYNDGQYVHILAADQGAYITIARLKPNSQTDINPIGIWQLVYAEYCPDTEFFSKVERDGDKEQVKEGRLSELIKEWKPVVAVIDREPNIASADNELKLFPDILWVSDSTGNANERLYLEKKPADQAAESVDPYTHRISENKHQQLDVYYTQIRNRRWEYANGGDDTWERFKTQHKNIKKVLGDDNSFKYMSFGDDHFAQSGKLLSVASEIYNIVKPRTVRAGVLILGGFSVRR